MKKEKKLLALWQERYSKNKSAYEAEKAKMDQREAQYKGDNSLRPISRDERKTKTTHVRNISAELVEAQVSSAIPQPKVTARRKEDEGLAKLIEDMLRNELDRLPFEMMNDMQERTVPIQGGSLFLVEWDNSQRTHTSIGELVVSIAHPKQVVPQEGVFTGIEDMDYCFLRFTATRAELCRSYGLREQELAAAVVEPDAALTVADDDCATVIVCFYRDAEGEVGQFVFSGELTLLDMPAYYRRKRHVCPVCGRDESLCRCDRQSKKPAEMQDELYEVVYRKTSLENGEIVQSFLYKNELSDEKDDTVLSIEELRVPYYTPKEFPIVIRKNTSAEGRVLGQSDCEFIRPEQQAINKVESRILQKLLRAGVTPVVPEDASVTLNNAVFGQVIKMKPGESLAQYGTVDTTPNIAQDIAEAERLYDHAKRTLGITDAYQGADNDRNKSGYARQLQIDRASGRLRSKRTMKQAAYAKMDRLLFSFYLAYADEPRTLSFRDAYGRIHNEAFRRLDFLTYDRATDSYAYDDGYLFSTDPNAAAEEARSELWQRNLENLRSGALGDPSDKMTLLRYWQAQERAHYPYARENVEYFRDALDEGGDTPWTL